MRNFRSLQEFLETRYPDLRGEVTGSNYPPPAHGVAAVQVAMAAQWGSLVLAFAGPSVFSTLGMPSPDWYQQLMQNKMTWFVGVFFANSFAQSLTATGAFEVEVDGQLVFSKLEKGRMPTAHDLVQGLEAIGMPMPDAAEEALSEAPGEGAQAVAGSLPRSSAAGTSM